LLKQRLIDTEGVLGKSAFFKSLNDGFGRQHARLHGHMDPFERRDILYGSAAADKHAAVDGKFGD